MTLHRPALLVIGGTEPTRRALLQRADSEGWDLRSEQSLAAGLACFSDTRFACTVLSIDLAGVDLELAGRVATQPNTGALVLIGTEPSLEIALGAAGAGVRRVLREPLGARELDALFEATGTARSDRVSLPEVAVATELVGRSPELLEVFESAGRVASSTATVLILGESGTGKELVARAVHRFSPRVKGPFVSVNCAAIPEDLLESELFGHERGAFTGAVARKIGRFERADAGTLFLDEIGDMSLVLQAKILRALQEREIERLGGEGRIRVDVRVIAATHRDLSELVASGEFREDLYYRLAVVVLRLPPLRERGDDIRELTLHYAARFAREHARPIRYVDAGALARLERHGWPGNVRELRNVVERAVLGAHGDTLTEADLTLEAPRHAPAGEPLPGYRPGLTLSEVEALHIRRVLRDVRGHVGQAAEILGVHRNTVTRKMAEHGITPR